ncbi:hydrolase [Bacillus timonensis]|nr:hydrolase [Bacillus timonensis]
MEDNKKTYYISLGSGEISQSKTSSTWDYEIQANDEEIVQLREYFDQNFSNDWQGFFRAHVPYVEYHHDPTNDAYDETLLKVYKMIYELGNEETKEHIKTQGIISSLSHETK